MEISVIACKLNIGMRIQCTYTHGYKNYSYIVGRRKLLEMIDMFGKTLFLEGLLVKNSLVLKIKRFI